MKTLPVMAQGDSAHAYCLIQRSAAVLPVRQLCCLTCSSLGACTQSSEAAAKRKMAMEKAAQPQRALAGFAEQHTREKKAAAARQPQIPNLQLRMERDKARPLIHGRCSEFLPINT